LCRPIAAKEKKQAWKNANPNYNSRYYLEHYAWINHRNRIYRANHREEYRQYTKDRRENRTETQREAELGRRRGYRQKNLELLRKQERERTKQRRIALEIVRKLGLEI
jgi:hypothetical protein